MDWREARIGGHVNPGWEPLVDELHRRVRLIDPDVIVEQVKEKFGGLRYYWNTDRPDDLVEQRIRGPIRVFDAIDAIVTQAEHVSYWICEVCGKPGAPGTYGHGWVNTLCAEHAGIRERDGTPAWQMANQEVNDGNA